MKTNRQNDVFGFNALTEVSLDKAFKYPLIYGNLEILIQAVDYFKINLQIQVVIFHQQQP